MNRISFTPIGIIHSPFESMEGMPIQPSGAKGITGTVVIDEKYVDGLRDLDGFSHIILLYQFHLSNGFSLKVRPFLDSDERGLFSTRAPRRPNAIGLSVVKLISVEKNILHIENIDVVDGTPLLDIKPYVPQFDNAENVEIGWLTGRVSSAGTHKSDTRFHERD